MGLSREMRIMQEEENARLCGECRVTRRMPQDADNRGAKLK